MDGLAGQQHHVAVEGEPTNSKHSHHQEQHGQGPPALSSLGSMLSRCGVAYGVVPPQAASNCGVGDGDDEERQHVKQDEGQEINILPVEIRWLREVWDTQASLILLTSKENYIRGCKTGKHDSRMRPLGGESSITNL